MILNIFINCQQINRYRIPFNIKLINQTKAINRDKQSGVPTLSSDFLTGSVYV